MSDDITKWAAREVDKISVAGAPLDAQHYAAIAEEAQRRANDWLHSLPSSSWFGEGDYQYRLVFRLPEEQLQRWSE